ncbi:MAG TPA: ABC transporter permease [Candidatus Fimivivens sp.]|nr:ABC transporter permease [Candidatus Fimivivens sp.]
MFLAALSIWELCAIIIPRFGFLFGSPSEIVVAFIRNTANGTLIGGFFVTGMEALTGFVVGVIFGTIAGFLLWYSPLIARIVRPYIVILGAVPVFAFAPMMIIWFGVGFGMKIAMAALGTFLVALTQAYEGAKNVDIEEFRLLRIFGATRFQVFMTVVLPSSLSWVLSSMKLNVGFALLGAFIGEFISSDNGLGHFMIRAGSFYDVSSVFAGGVYLVFLALLFEKMVNLVEKKQKKITEFVSVSRKTRQALKGVREEE